MKALSLFSGIGGIDLAAEWAGIETVAMCEREPFCQKVLKKHWPHVPIYDDVCTLTKERLEQDGIGAIELIHGGYPCQPYSIAGKQRGTEDDRALWPEVKRLLQEIRPRWFVGENVDNHINLGLDDVLSGLEDIGYTAESFVIPSAAVRAPHRRYRVFVVAYPNDRREHEEQAIRTRWNAIKFSGSDVAYADIITGLETDQKISTIGSRGNSWNDVSGSGWKSATRENWGTVKSGVGRVDNGISSKLDEHRWPAFQRQQQHEWEPPRTGPKTKTSDDQLKALGNAVNPYQIYPILAAIKQIDDMMKEETL